MRRAGIGKLTRAVAAGAAGTLVLSLLTAVGISGAGAARPHAKAHHGGSITVVENNLSFGAWPGGFDPAASTTTEYNQSMMDSIYGELFELGKNGQTIDDLATGYKFEDGGKRLLVYLRKGVKFSDGTPFNAAAVVWNYKRDFASSTCTCKAAWPIAKTRPFVATGRYTVEINFATPFAPAVNSFHAAQMNWIASPSAYRKMGKQAFTFMPVGAGPFIAVKDITSNEFVVKRNPNYWKKGLPYLNEITFKSIAAGQPTVDAMEAGQAQVVEGDGNPSDLGQFYQRGFYVNKPKSVEPYTIQLNTFSPPFNNIKARLAVYYATNAKAIDKELFNGLNTLTQSFTGPGGFFFMPKVPGYPGYDLSKAKALVKQLGGLTFTIAVPASPENELFLEALQGQWAQAGIHVTLQPNPLPAQIQLFLTHKWQAVLNTTGALDPAIGQGVNWRFLPGGIYDGVNDPNLTHLLLTAEQSLSTSTRTRLYLQAAELIAKQAYMPFLFTFQLYTIAAKGVIGPGVTTRMPVVVDVQEIHWENVFLKK